MIITHPLLFNAIVVFFIAFTSGWMVFVLTGRRSVRFKKRIHALEAEKQQLSSRIEQLEEQLRSLHPLPVNNPAPVIPFSANRINKTN